MKAKLLLESVRVRANSEILNFTAVTDTKYGGEGWNEDNTYAKFTPTATLEMCVTNSDLWGQFVPGQKFYVDFTLA